uniref:Uncharacterized protein n=1 Tax=Anguilla anguilla TaxID=7936 RepID=A0A0E9W0P7_ANGAN
MPLICPSLLTRQTV